MGHSTINGIFQSGYSGFSGYSGTSGCSGFSGTSGCSGFSGLGGTGIQEKLIEVTTASTGVNTPDTVKVGKMDCLSFDPTVDEAVDFILDMPDDAVLTSDMSLIIGYHMSTLETVNNAVRLHLDYEVVPIETDTTPANTRSQDTTFSTPTGLEIRREATFTIYASDFTAVTNSLRFTLKRDADYVGDVHPGEFRVESLSVRYNGFGAPTTNSGYSGASGTSDFNAFLLMGA